MALVNSTKRVVYNLQRAFFLSKLLGLFTLVYNEREQKFEQSACLSKYGRSVGFLWYCTALPMSFFLYVNSRLLEMEDRTRHSEVQRTLLCLVNASQLWLGVATVYHNHASSKTLLLHTLNAMIKCNRNLMKLIKQTALPRNRFHTFFVIRVLTTAVDIYITHSRPMEFNLFMAESECLVVCQRIVMLSSFFEWYFIQTHLTATVDTLNAFMEREGPRLGSRDYHKLSKLYTQLFHLQQASCRYYQPFALVTCAGLLRTIGMAFQTFQALFLTRLKKTPLGSTVITFKLFMIPAMASALDFIMICVMAEFLSTSAELYRWIFLTQSLKAKGDESIQRTIEMILRQSCWEQLSWVLVTGNTISRATSFMVVDASISLTVAFLIYDAGYSVVGPMVEIELETLERYHYYFLCMVFTVGCMTCHKIISWCESDVFYKV